MKSYKRFGSIQDTAVFGDDTTHGALYLVIILTIFYTDHPIYTTRILTAVISHCTTAQRTVRDIDYLIVGCGQNRMEDLNLTYRSGHSLAFNPVAYLERTEQQYNQSTRKILQVSGKCHTDSHTGRCQQSCKRSSFHSQFADNGNNQQNGQQDID